MAPVRSAAALVVLGLMAGCTGGSTSDLSGPSEVGMLDEPSINADTVPSPESSFYDVDLKQVEWSGWKIDWPSDWRGAEPIGSGWLILLGPNDTLHVEVDPNPGQDIESVLQEWSDFILLLDRESTIGRTDVTERDDGVTHIVLEFRAPNEGDPRQGSIHSLRSSDRVLTLTLQSSPARFAERNREVERLLASVVAAPE